MDDFSRSDALRAVLAPLCCFPTCRLAPAVHLSDAEDDDGDGDGDGAGETRDWYEQSRPSGFVPIPGHWEDANERTSRREADLLSLHEGLLGAQGEGGGTAERRARRVRGGDISGSGSVGGSGLSRWTLLRSWWKGTGRVVLPDDEEEEGDQEGTDEEEGDITREEIPVVRIEDTKPPPTVSSASGTHSDAVTTNDDQQYDLEREARRIERRARRDARQAGFSTQLVDPYDHGPPSLPSRRSHGSQASSSRSRDHDLVHIDNGVHQSSNGSHGFDFHEQVYRASSRSNSEWGTREEEEEREDDAELRREERRNRRRERRENGEEAASSRGSQSANGDAETDVGGGSSNGSYSSRRGKLPHAPSTQSHLLSPNLVPLPSSPAAESPRHRQYPSVSSNSNSVTSNSSRPRRKKVHSPLQPAVESYEVPGQDPTTYFTDANGQMQPYPAGQWVLDDVGQPYYLPYIEPTDPSLQGSYDHIAPTAYDHIAPLPAPSTIDEPPIIIRTPTPPQSKIVTTSSDPTSFLQALKSTKLPSPLPSPPPIIAPVVPLGKDQEEEPEVVLPWGGIMEERKGNGWEGGEGALESVWRDRAFGDSEDEDED